MHSRVKPGGRIVIQEYYFPTVDSYPTVEALLEFKTIFFGVYEKEGRETRMGVKLPAFFIEAGIGAPKLEGTNHYVLSPSLKSAWKQKPPQSR
jgi:hypothetical protein